MSTVVGSGEFGTKLETDGDKAWLHDLSQWVNNIGPANDGLHSDVTSFFYWYAQLTPLLSGNALDFLADTRLLSCQPQLRQTLS